MKEVVIVGGRQSFEVIGVEVFLKRASAPFYAAEQDIQAGLQINYQIGFKYARIQYPEDLIVKDHFIF